MRELPLLLCGLCIIFNRYFITILTNKDHMCAAAGTSLLPISKLSVSSNVHASEVHRLSLVINVRQPCGTLKNTPHSKIVIPCIPLSVHVSQTVSDLNLTSCDLAQTGRDRDEISRAENEI